MKRREEILGYLSKVPLFSACTKKELQHLARYTERLTVAAGTRLTQEGRIGYEFYVLLDGKARVLRGDTEVNVLGPGDFFGELALLDRAPRNATVEAITDVDTLVMAQREFSAALEVVPTVAHKLLQGLARRIHEVDRQSVN